MKGSNPTFIQCWLKMSFIIPVPRSVCLFKISRLFWCVFYFRMIGLTVIFFLGMTLFHFTEYADFWHFLTKVSNTNACLYQYFILNTLSLMSLETLKKYGTFEIEYDPFWNWKCYSQLLKNSSQNTSNWKSFPNRNHFLLCYCFAHQKSFFRNVTTNCSTTYLQKNNW